ncbi:MAG: DNA-binding response regulator [Hyphomicrobium sp.]|nr:MAG: DNA-binding response regulator [Hyphomicrobium sp.]
MVWKQISCVLEANRDVRWSKKRALLPPCSTEAGLVQVQDRVGPMTEVSSSRFSGTILVADDHELVRDSLVRVLRQELQPRAIIEADSLDTAIAALAGGGVTLAMFDLGMPGLAGPHQLREIRERWPDVRVIVVTGSVERTHVLEALQAGVHGYIVKSARIAEILAEVRLVLGGRISVPALIADLPPRVAAPGKPAEDHVVQLGPGPDATPEPGPNEPITGRKRDVLAGLAAGLTNKEIARDLGVSEGTVKMHVSKLFQVLKANNRAHAAALGKSWLR